MEGIHGFSALGKQSVTSLWCTVKAWVRVWVGDSICPKLWSMDRVLVLYDITNGMEIGKCDPYLKDGNLSVALKHRESLRQKSRKVEYLEF